MNLKNLCLLVTFPQEKYSSRGLKCRIMLFIMTDHVFQDALFTVMSTSRLTFHSFTMDELKAARAYQ